MATQQQTARYDRGYEDAIEGRVARSQDGFYRRGYCAGLRLAQEANGQFGVGA